jgi:plastocyanin
MGQPGVGVGAMIGLLTAIRGQWLALFAICGFAVASGSGGYQAEKAHATTFPVLATIAAQFAPNTLTIGSGDTINFTLGAGFHGIGFRTGNPAILATIPHPMAGVNPRAFTLAGTYYFFCTVHTPGFVAETTANYDAAILANIMVGRVIVQGPSTFVVLNTNDSGAGSLRQAITDANGHAGPDVIEFNIGPNDGLVKSIKPLTVLPNINENVLINGYSQPQATRNTLAVGNDARILIELDGALVPAALCNQLTGLRVEAPDGVSITGLVVNNFCTGIWLHIGQDHTIDGCFVGTNASGTIAKPNGDTGIFVSVTSNSTIGGALPGDRNLVSGNGSVGIGTDSTNGIIVSNNYVGTDRTGMLALPNKSAGIDVNGQGTAVLGNVVSGHTTAQGGSGHGITIRKPNAVVTGNIVGLTANGSGSLGNRTGIHVEFDATGAQIGQPGAGNVIGGNFEGIDLRSVDTIVQANLIGTNANGAALGNVRAGIFSTGGGLVGGAGAGEANVIAFNEFGVMASAGAVQIQKNSIYGNTTLGIRLGAGLTPNDPLDADSGPNGLQNFPLATVADLDSTGFMGIHFELDTKANTGVDIEFFVSPTCDENGRGQGKTFILGVHGTTDGAGNTGGDTGVANADAYAGQFLVLTATTPEGTSEFSACKGITSPCPGPSPINLMAGATGEVWCGGPKPLTGQGAQLPPALVSALFEWDNAAQQFHFWFRGFPDGFQTLVAMDSLHHYFFQATGAVPIANADPGSPNLGAGPVDVAIPQGGAFGMLWFGTFAPTSSFDALTAPVTALFKWDNPGQRFKFWFRGFPPDFQTLTTGIERGRFYFFQVSGPTTIAVK